MNYFQITHMYVYTWITTSYYNKDLNPFPCSDKITLEEKLSLRTARLEALSSQKKEMEGSHLAVEELVQNLQLKADQLNLEKEALSSDLHSKTATIENLETKLCKCNV